MKRNRLYVPVLVTIILVIAAGQLLQAAEPESSSKLPGWLKAAIVKVVKWCKHTAPELMNELVAYVRTGDSSYLQSYPGLIRWLVKLIYNGYKTFGEPVVEYIEWAIKTS